MKDFEMVISDFFQIKKCKLLKLSLKIKVIEVISLFFLK